MDGARRPRRNLVVVQRHENILRIPPRDPVPLAVQHEHIHKMRPRIDLALAIERPASPNDPLPAAHYHIHPHFIRIHCPLREWMPHLHRANHRLQEIFLPGLQRRHARPQRRNQLPIHRAVFAQAKNIHPHHPFEKLLVCRNDLRLIADVRQPGIGRREQVIVYAQLVRAEELGPKIIRFLQRHVASGAILLRLGRIIKTPRPMPAHAAEQKRVVMILPPQPLVIVQFRRQVHLVTRRAKLGRLVQRLEKRLLVKRRLGLHHLVVDPLQNRVVALGKRIMYRLFDRVIRIPPRVLNVGDRMTHRAGHPRLRRRVLYIVKIRIIKSPAEKRHLIVTAGAPARSLHRIITLEGKLPGLANRRQISGIIERAEMVRAVKPAVEVVLMALQAIAVHHQRARRDEIAGRSARLLIASTRTNGKYFSPSFGPATFHKRGSVRCISTIATHAAATAPA